MDVKVCGGGARNFIAAPQVAYHISNPAAYSVEPTGLTPQIEYAPSLQLHLLFARSFFKHHSHAIINSNCKILQRGVAT